MKITYRKTASLPGRKTSAVALIILAAALLLSGCESDISAVRDGFLSLIGEEPWEDDRGPGHAPTVEELMEMGAIEDDEFRLEGAGESEAAGVFELGHEPGEEEIRLSTKGMLRYSYAELSDEERVLYRDIYTVLYNHTGEVTLSTLDADEVDKVFQLVMNDHPEIFYVTGYSMNKYMQGDETISLEFNGTYDKTRDQEEAARPLIDEYVDECLGNMPDYDRDYDKVKYIYTYIIENTEYDLGAKDNQNILSVFTSGRTVCQGYAKATQYLLNEVGIPCLLVTGMVKEGETHAWNLAYVDGKWTYVDTTWGDASYRNVSTGDTWNEISYDYLCVGEDEIFGSHHITSLIDLPVGEKI